jgi:DNA-binding beta-propeller fold protein YncE
MITDLAIAETRKEIEYFCGLGDRVTDQSRRRVLNGERVPTAEKLYSIDKDAKAIYVADGYGNHRVIVFDATSGAYKRHWGAYGNPPSDDKQPPYDPKAPVWQQFANPVHCVKIANDGLVYVCDRINNRIQVFKKDGSSVKGVVL